MFISISFSHLFFLMQTASRPGSQHLKCLLRVTFVPKDAYDLLSRDPTAFDYFYLQVSNSKVASWLFSKRSKSVIFDDCNFYCFLGICTTFFRNPVCESSEISRIGLPVPHLYYQVWSLIKFSEQFTKSEIFDDDFFLYNTLKTRFSWIFFAF